ncbi:MAG: hypothetical protein J7L19_01100 [Dehalococcoidia bacterium]|nr:hypothetical protein [Dehalococcoidia bacterium]
MPKKSHRTKAKHRAKLARKIQKENFQLPKPATTQSQLPNKTSSVNRKLDVRHQYLIPELRRIGILAGAMITTLIVLSFILG